MKLTELLRIQRGITAVIGGGGKTALIQALAEDLNGSVIICTSTHIYPSSRFPTLVFKTEQEIVRALKASRVLLIGEICEDGKIVRPGISFERISAAADFVLVEADGARHLPAKAHSATEPVIPKNCTQTIWVIGAFAFGRSIKEAVHRPEVYAKYADVSVEMPVTPENMAMVVRSERIADRIFVNQIETKEALICAEDFASRVDIPVAGGSLKLGKWRSLK